MKKAFEYKKVEGKITIEDMNKLGADGWELLYQRDDSYHGIVTYFKKEK